MRKISHINLGKALLTQKNVFQVLRDEHLKKKSFVLGNVLPDCLPTFIYIRHNIESTFEIVKGLIKDLLNLKIDTHRFWIKLGCTMHYIADYFTYPHTRLFKGGFNEHNKYEKFLKNSFEENLKRVHNKKVQSFHNINELFYYIKEEQQIYFIEKEENLDNPFLIDTDYIFHVCETIFINIMNLKKCAA